MAKFKNSCLLILVCSHFLLLLFSSHRANAKEGCFTSIVSFGDSLSDTGNLPIAERIGNYTDALGGVTGKLPDGMTYFNRDSGRASDGRIFLDFIDNELLTASQAFELPLVPPYLGGPGNTDFQKGVNFAVTGSTALDADFFASRGITLVFTNDSWSVQNDWFRHLLPTLCQSQSEQACAKYFDRSLVFLGEIGANDYNYGFFKGVTITEMEKWIPQVIDKISETAQMLAGLGAKTLVFPNIPPFGCSSAFLTIARSAAKDDVGCIRSYSDFLIEHNNQLLREVLRLRKQFPRVTMIYADFYAAVYSIIRSPRQYGFTNAFGACCGSGGPFNWNLKAVCGNPGTTVCSDPSKYIHWDGIHYTEAVYKIVSEGFLQGKFATPIGSCPNQTLKAL